MNEEVQAIGGLDRDAANDAQLLRDLRADLGRGPPGGAEHVHATVHDAIAILSGYTTTSEAKAAIRSIAQRVIGIRDVYDGVEVRADPADTDDAILARIQAMFGLDAGVRSDGLTVTVARGRVVLSGHVEWPTQAEAAIAAARRVRGVTSVTSTIQADGVPSLAAIRGRIALAFQQASEADAAAVVVTVQGGAVRLSGKLPCTRERDLAEATVRALPGVTSVRNDIAVD
jgi:osmotically-inducible protein OsmY